MGNSIWGILYEEIEYIKYTLSLNYVKSNLPLCFGDELLLVTLLSLKIHLCLTCWRMCIFGMLVNNFE